MQDGLIRWATSNGVVLPITFYTSLYVIITPVCPIAVLSLRSHATILPHPVCPARRPHAGHRHGKTVVSRETG